MPKIVVIGSTNVDLIMRLPHLPSKGETVTDGTFLQTFGGKGANTAVGAQRAGGDVTFISAVGDDGFGSQVQESLARDGINLDHVQVAPGAATGTALIMFDGEGANYLSVAPGANYELRPEHLEAAEDVIAAASMMLLQMEIPIETNRAALALAAKHGLPVLFNFAPARTRELELSGHMTTLVVNEVEAAELSGLPVEDQAGATAAAQALLGFGHSLVVVTMGSAGVLLVRPDTVDFVPAFRVAAVDTTAAGDIFCGSFAVAVSEGKDVVAAARFASSASAISVTRVGAQPSAPTRSEIEAFLG